MKRFCFRISFHLGNPIKTLFFTKRIWCFLIFSVFHVCFGDKICTKIPNFSSLVSQFFTLFYRWFYRLPAPWKEDVRKWHHVTTATKICQAGGKESIQLGLFKMIGFPKRESVKPSNKPTKMASNGKIAHFF